MSNLLIDRLQGVKRSGDRQWVARCPAHDDRDPSLSVKELNDGRILIHCFAGCGGADVMAAVGLSLSDLYPDGALSEFSPHWHMRREKNESDARWRHAMTVLKLYHLDRANGREHSLSDLREVWEARKVVAES